MATNRVPIFANSTDTVHVAITTADTSLTAPTNFGIVYANTTGVTVIISKVRFKANAATTASMIRLFLYDGSSQYLYREYLTSTLTPSATVKSDEIQDEEEIYLQTGWTLRAVTVGGDDYTVFADVNKMLYAA